jgi:hypothetical protein
MQFQVTAFAVSRRTFPVNERRQLIVVLLVVINFLGTFVTEDAIFTMQVKDGVAARE